MYRVELPILLGEPVEDDVYVFLSHVVNWVRAGGRGASEQFPTMMCYRRCQSKT
jgi:hypothetical protein